VAVIKKEHKWFHDARKSCKIPYAVIVKNLNAVAATRYPTRWIIVYQNKLIQENTYRYTVRFRCKDKKNTTELAAFWFTWFTKKVKS
jgi:hypothetical protein